jgi:hypothetical protein
MKETAVDHFKARRGNCAQAVARAWAEKNASEMEPHEPFAVAGGGRAPGGCCGALHAARELAGEHKEPLTEQFKARAGGFTECRDIRRNRVMPCAECVGLAATLLEQFKKRNES